MSSPLAAPLLTILSHRFRLSVAICTVLCSFLFIAPGNISAQSVTFQGVVNDAEGEVPLQGSNVVLRKLPDLEPMRGAVTDRYGFFQIRPLEPGDYELTVTYVGYVTFRDTVRLGDQAFVTMAVALERDEELLDEVQVRPTIGPARLDAGQLRVTRTDLSRVVTPAAGGDLASYLQALPGVVSTGDRGGQLFIRGGTPSQNMVLMDGTMIYQPFHIAGFFSVFPENLVTGADFYAGGFGPRYNSRTSSVLDVQMRHGDLHRFRGSASVSPLIGDLHVEGPFVPGEASWIVSLRRSLIEQTSPVLHTEKQPLHFESQYVKVTQMMEDSRCSAMILRTQDRGQLDFDREDVFKWGNFAIGGRCLIVPQQSGLFMDLNMGVSNMSNTAENQDFSNFSSGITRFHLDANLTQYAGQVRFDYGFFSYMKWFDYDMMELFRSPLGESDGLLGLGLNLETTIPVGDHITVQPGAVFSLHPDFYAPSFEPRFRTSWRPFGRDSEQLSATVGLYRQALVGVTDMRDASSVFVAWMPSPFGDSQMEAIHAMAGWQQRLGGGFELSLEGYHKWIRNQPVTVWSTVAQFSTDLARADGIVYGADLRLEYNSRRLYGFVGYGYSVTEYESAQDHFSVWFGEPVQRYHPPHDRRHQINSMMSWRISDYLVNVRWQLGSGLPFTRPMGFDGLIDFTDGLPDVRQRYGTPRVILERPFQGRLPVYHRMDVSVERTFSFESMELALEAGVINAYNQRNIFYYDVYTHRRIDQLPFSPYVSLKMGIPR